MPGSMESIVRPFETGQITPPKTGVLSIPAVVPNVVLLAGGTGSGKILNGSFDETSTVYVVKQPKEEVE